MSYIHILIIETFKKLNVYMNSFSNLPLISIHLFFSITFSCVRGLDSNEVSSPWDFISFPKSMQTNHPQSLHYLWFIFAPCSNFWVPPTCLGQHIIVKGRSAILEDKNLFKKYTVLDCSLLKTPLGLSSLGVESWLLSNPTPRQPPNFLASYLLQYLRPEPTNPDLM